MPGQAIVFRDVKGSLLTASEVDENFRNLLLYRGGGMRNRLRNPRMEVAQRGASGAVAPGLYTVDGWKLNYVTSAAFGFAQAADVPANAEYQYSLQLNCTGADTSIAAGDVLYIEQPIEGFLVRDLLGNPIAIQFDSKHTVTGTYCVALQNSGNDRSYVWTYTQAASNTWQRNTLTLPTGLISAGTWNWTTGVGLRLCFTAMCGSTFQTAAGAWQAGNYLGVAGHANAVSAASNIFTIGCPQLERGFEPGGREHRDPVLEMLLNQRYLETITYAGSGFALLSGQLAGATSSYHQWRFAATKRAPPTFAVNSGAWIGSTPTVYANTEGLQFQSSTNYFYLQGTAGALAAVVSSEL